MNRQVVLTLVVVALLGCTAPAWAQPVRDPSVEDERRGLDDADSTLAAVRGWKDLHRVYPALRPWDDGYVAEGISDFVVHRLATRWDSFPELATIARADTLFGSWVVNHIDATTDWDELAGIIRHASTAGPRRDAAYRHRIGDAARAANIEAHRAVESRP